MKKIPRTVVALGVVSFLTDLSTEMIYPLLPAFLITLGAGGTFVGLVEGIADSTSSLLKLASGIWADRVKRKKPLVVLGYGIASVVRPFVALAQAPWHVLAIRFTDRVGKGIRSSPRDALIAQATDESARGAAFGFHQAMDNAGALFGPLVAYALVGWLLLSVRSVFALAAIPAAITMIALLAFVKEESVGTAPKKEAPHLLHKGAVPVPSPLRAYYAILFLFYLGNSTDFFLLLRARDVGVAEASLPLLWALLNLVRSALGTWLGGLSDRVGRKRLIAFGWLAYAAVYFGFGLATQAWHIWALFAIYGLHSAATDGAERALVADLAPREIRGRAFGLYNFVVGIAALPASVGFGVVWQHVGHAAAFSIGAGLALLSTLLIFLITDKSRPPAR